VKAATVHGFGGGFTLGAVQAGFELDSTFTRDVGFGVYATLANRHLLGDTWESVASSPDQWDTRDVDLVMGNPPCSGFSTLSPKAFRGTNSAINDYMWELVTYAGRVAPPMVIWESVQTTFRQGLELMRQLHDKLEELSGQQYTLTHVLHNNLSHGGVSMRKRYFWVASRVPFGVDHGRVDRQGDFQDLDRVPVFRDMLRDLAPLGLTMAPQQYRSTVPLHTIDDDGEYVASSVRVLNSSKWSEREAHDGTGIVDGHDIYHSKTFDRTRELLEVVDTPWAEGENMSSVLRKYYAEHKKLTPSWNYMTKKVDPVTGETVALSKAERLIETDFAMGHNQPTRWRADRPANVITGGAVHLVVHPWLDRLITHREAARIQGFPDDWKIWPVRTAPDVGPGWGKGVPVQAGRWVARWARAALEGEPGPITGVPLRQYNKKLAEQFGDREREFIVDTTYDFRNLSVQS
jgi:site-specific DNA-cytosine methylase